MSEMIWIRQADGTLEGPVSVIALTVLTLAAGLALDAAICRVFGNNLGKALLGTRIEHGSNR